MSKLYSPAKLRALWERFCDCSPRAARRKLIRATYIGARDLRHLGHSVPVSHFRSVQRVRRYDLRR